MKRTEFIKNLALTMGGTTLLACEADLVSTLLPIGQLESLEIDEAKSFFEKDYLKKFSGLRITKENHHNRRVNWSKAFKEKKKKTNSGDTEHEFVVVPIEYDENKFPAIMMYTEETKYLTQIPRAGSLPIKEYLIVYRNKNKNEAFLAQVCAHPSDNTTVMNNFVDMNAFTGILIKTDWEDKPSTGYRYVKGKVTQYFDTSITTKAKINCLPTNYSYQTVTIQPCSGNYGVSFTGSCLEAVYTYYTQTNWICFLNIPFDPYAPYFYYPSYSSGGSTAGGNSISSLLDTTAYPNNSKGYNVCRVAGNIGGDRSIWNNTIQHTWSALGLFNNIQGLTVDGANVLSKSLGGELKDFFPVAYSAGKWISGIGVVVDGVNFTLAINQSQYSSDQLYKDPNLHFKGTLLVFGAAAAFAALPLDAVIVGGLLIYYGILETDFNQKCN